MLIEIQNKGIQFDSPYDNGQVAIEFRRLYESGQIQSDFAKSVYQGAKRFGKYTPGQLPWLHVFVAKVEGRPTQPPVAAIGGFQLIHAHLADCRKSRDDGGKGLLYPMVGLEVGGQNVVLKLAGPKSKQNGKVSIASDHRYGQGQFYGYIDENGDLEARKPVPQAVLDILDRVAQDPARVISEIGKESGRCCYCFAELTTVQSKIAGCGKTCADNYRTEYPNTAETRQYVLGHQEILEGASDRDKWELAPA